MLLTNITINGTNNILKKLQFWIYVILSVVFIILGIIYEKITYKKKHMQQDIITMNNMTNNIKSNTYIEKNFSLLVIEFILLFVSFFLILMVLIFNIIYSSYFKFSIFLSVLLLHIISLISLILLNIFIFKKDFKKELLYLFFFCSSLYVTLFILIVSGYINVII